MAGGGAAAGGENTGALIGAFVMFLYLDFIGSSITFVSLGQMAGEAGGEGVAAGGVGP